MSKVNLYKLNNNAKQELVLTFSLENNQVIMRGSATKLIEKIQREGIIDYTSKFQLPIFSDDGLKFLEQLKYNFKTAYLMATDVLED